MTSARLLSRHVMSRSPLFNPTPGTFHLRTVIQEGGKDGRYARWRPSAHVIGILIIGVYLGLIAPWEAALYQFPFVYAGGQIGLRRSMMKWKLVNGHPFLGPDNLVLRIGPWILRGDRLDIGISDRKYISSGPYSAEGALHITCLTC